MSIKMPLCAIDTIDTGFKLRTIYKQHLKWAILEKSSSDWKNLEQKIQNIDLAELRRENGNEARKQSRDASVQQGLVATDIQLFWCESPLSVTIIP